MSLDLVEPCLRTAKGEISVVIDPICKRGDGQTVALTVLHRQMVVISGDKDVQGRTTLFRYTCHVEGTDVILKPTAHSSELVHTQAFRSNFRVCVEACAGIAAVTEGYRANQVDTVMHVEESAAFVNVLRQRGQQAIHGDIAAQSTVQQLASCQPGFLSAGVSCQPFSSLGDGLESLDDRAKSFPAMLRATYLLQIPVLILECTKQALTSQWVQGMLQSFCEKTGMFFHQKLLNIGGFWPAKRLRWWCVVYNRFLQVEPIPDFPQFPYQPSIMHLVPRLFRANQVNVEELVLDAHEVSEFASRPTMDKHMCNCFKQLPTATHSWGSELLPCPCGCRSAGFRSERLNDKGLYGQLVSVPASERQHVRASDTVVRHLHAREVAILNGLDPRQVEDLPGQQRLMLAGVGQLASPLQSGWVMAYVLKAIHVNFMRLDHFREPIDVLRSMIRNLFQARDECFEAITTPLTTLFQQSHDEWGVPVDARPRTLNPSDEAPVCDDVPIPHGLTSDHESNTAHVSMNSSPVANMDHDTSPDFLAPASLFGGLFASGADSGAVKRSHSETKADLEQQLVSFLDSEGAEPENHEPAAKRPCIHDRVDEEEPAVTPRQVVDETGLSVNVILPGQGVQSIRFCAGATVGQLSTAMHRIHQVPQVHKVTNAMGQLLSMQDQLFDGQYVRVTDVGDEVPEFDPPTLGLASRQILLWDQLGWVASDEMSHYLDAVEASHPNTVIGVKIIPPTADVSYVVSKSVVFAFQCIQADPTSTHKVWAMLWEHHWFPIVAQRVGDDMHVWTDSASVNFVSDCLSATLESHPIAVHASEMTNAFPHDCGFQTIGWIIAKLNDDDTSQAFTIRQACQWRALYHQFLLDTNRACIQVTVPLELGGTTALRDELARLVAEHGVRAQRSKQCADELLQSLGGHAIQQALRAPKPWADLKAKASAQSPPLRIVLSDELKEQIDQRAKNPKSVGSKHNKKSRTQEPALNLAPDQLLIPKGVFADDSNQPLEQIQVNQLGSKSRGVCLVKAQEVLHFASLTSPVSPEGVAALVVDFQNLPTRTQHQIVRVPMMSSFPRWVDQHLHLACPCTIPTAAAARVLSEAFLGHLREMERQLNQVRCKRAATRRQEDPNIIFRDLKGDPPQPVQMLINKQVSIVAEVVDDESALVVDPPQEWNPDQAILTPKGPIAIVHAEPDKLWVSNVENVTPGMQRVELRQAGFRTRLAARDLGGHVAYSKMPTNATITQRCEAMPTLWNKLARSLSSYHQKVRAVKAKAWPCCLHAVASVHLRDEVFTTLRTGAVKGLKEDAPGVSYLVHASLIEQPMFDPQYFALQTTVMTFRDMHPTPDQAEAILSVLHEPSRTNGNKPGPISVLLVRLQQVAWSWKCHCVFADQYGQDIDVLNCSVQELVIRLRGAWQDRVKALVAHRPSFDGIVHASPVLTLEDMASHDPQDQAILRACLNGTQFTADHLKHRDQQATGTCAFCGQADSQMHRHWYCPHFADCRMVPVEHIDSVPAISACLANHGWVPEPPSFRAFNVACASLPSSVQFLWPECLPTELHLFTDGGCLSPACPYSRLAGWGIAMASGDYLSYTPLAGGLLPGWVQTILRAEVFAVIHACTFAFQVMRKVTLWVDNMIVYRRVLQMQRGAFTDKPNRSNADLWQHLHMCVQALGPGQLQVQHVYSHQQITDLTDAEMFAVRGNAAADHIATVELQQSGPLQQLRAQVAEDLKHVRCLRRLVHGTLINVGKAAIQQKQKSGSDKPTHTGAVGRDLHGQPVEPLVVPSVRCSDLERRYQWDGMVEYFQWLQTITSDQAPVSFVSYYQFYILYEHHSDLRGIRYCKKTKQWHRLTAASPKIDFVQKCNNLVKYTKNAITTLGTPWLGIFLKPSSSTIQFWTMCLPLRLKPDLVRPGTRLSELYVRSRRGDLSCRYHDASSLRRSDFGKSCENRGG
eukprot:Skav233642  [mRNA]  locus=scaffold2779:446218:453058:- [translate_table: standard]